MEIINKLKEQYLWEEFLNYKTTRADIRKKEQEDLQKFINEKEYVTWVNDIENSKEMSLPHIIEVNKNGVNKKRTVFTFGREENYILKMIAYLLKEYDNLFCDNLYSFRNNTGVKKAVGKILLNVDFDKTYSYKVDIQDYFNSINTEKILKLFKDKIPEEQWLYAFFERLLKNPYGIKDGKQVNVKKGIMAGTPTACFLANLYLSDLDRYFMEQDVLYGRYSDDIIVFSENKKDINKYENTIKEFLRNRSLEINPNKEVMTAPGEKVVFLGFEFTGIGVSISETSEKKIKAKIKRKARALYRWKLRKQASNERAAKALIRYVNNKFYKSAIKGEITWCRWFFPVITSDKKLKRIDEYIVNNIRYLYTGKYGKKNYNLRYSDIKRLGYISLVNSYWKYKAGKEIQPI